MQPIQIILILMKVSVISVVFLLGIETTAKDITYLFRNYKQLVRSLIPMYIIMPIVAGIIVSLSNIDPVVKIALLALSVSPSAPRLPKRQLKLGANKSYVIGLLVAVSLLSIILIPITLTVFEIVFNKSAQIPLGRVMQIVIFIILLPLLIGLVTRYTYPRFAIRIIKPLSLIAFILLLISTLVIFSIAIKPIITLIEDGTILVILIFILIGLTAGYYFGGRDINNRAALSLATVSRHPGIAIIIAQTNFPQQKLVPAAILLYIIVNIIVTTIYINRHKTKN